MRPVKVYREGREDRAYLLERHGAGPREMSEGRSVEARQHDAEAPLQGHLTEHLRRRDAGGEDGADHARLVRDGPLRDAGLPQLQDLARRPGVDVGEFAFADLFAQGSLHCPAPDAPRFLAYVRTNRGMTPPSIRWERAGVFSVMAVELLFSSEGRVIARASRS